MNDVKEIREALDFLESAPGGVVGVYDAELKVRAGARAYVELVERGVEVWAWNEPYEGMFFYTDDDLDLVKHGQGEGPWFFEDERRYFVAAVVPEEATSE